MVAWSRARKARAWAAVKGPSVRFLPGRWRLICSRLVNGLRSVTGPPRTRGPVRAEDLVLDLPREFRIAVPLLKPSPPP
jgi:hypothetical protein